MGWIFNWNTIVDPLNGEPFIKVVEVDETGVQPFVESLSSCHKHGLHNPFKDVQNGSTSRNIHPLMDEGFPIQQNNMIHWGKNVVDSISMDKLYTGF
ncbi:hypothetical protein MTR_1g051515 [Medicago truncatula]|uniref:Uncharacterized protein n=1 Tax=Medicago truncatula TaxID=3880 RepID=A0A072VIR0_MEDTR|nr:hypothetical protein MTR_1g051515 [Medicago truncatula]